jgi:hypothetical protein
LERLLAKKKYIPQTWLERKLLQGGYLAFVTSQDEYARALKELKLEYKSDYVPNGWPACTHAFACEDGSLACIVGLDLGRCAEEDPIDVAALLVHEAVHVWQNTESRAGKLGCFGDEGEAYAIQNISTALMTEYARRING